MHTRLLKNGIITPPPPIVLCSSLFVSYYFYIKNGCNSAPLTKTFKIRNNCSLSNIATVYDIVGYHEIEQPSGLLISLTGVITTRLLTLATINVVFVFEKFLLFLIWRTHGTDPRHHANPMIVIDCSGTKIH